MKTSYVIWLWYIITYIIIEFCMTYQRVYTRDSQSQHALYIYYNMVQLTMHNHVVFENGHTCECLYSL